MAWFSNRQQPSVIVSEYQEEPVMTLARGSIGIKEVGFGSETELEEYLEVADEFELSGRAMENVKLKKFFKNNMISIYDYRRVAAYLLSKTPSGKDWRWLPLREQDKGKGWELGTSYYNERWVYNGEIDSRIYAHAVPYPVLLTARKIAKEFGDKVAFYVSDYVSPNPDPFLAVKTLNSDMFVIEKWDEPGFRG